MSADADFLRLYSGARALVFGATGFIGRHAARALAAAGAHVTLSARDAGALADLAHELAGVTDILPADVCDDAQVVATVRHVRPHITFSLAGYGVGRAERDESQAASVNSRFPRVLCDAIVQYRDAVWAGQALIHAGSQLEYGPIGGEMAEDRVPSPHTLYGRTKLDGTRAIERCAVSHSLPALTARLFTVYGPGERQGRLLPTLMRAAATREPVDLTDGVQRADFTWIGDVVEGLLRLGVVPAQAGARRGPGDTVGPRPGDIVNLASGRLQSVREFAVDAAAALGVPESLLRFGVLPQRTETLEYEPVDNRRLRALTGWAPSTTVTEAVRTIMNEQERSDG